MLGASREWDRPYLGYGVVASNILKIDPGPELPEGYRPPLALWWLGIWLIAEAFVLTAAILGGIFRTRRRALLWLVLLPAGITAFNIADHLVFARFPRIYLGLIIIAAVCIVRVAFDRMNISPRNVMKTIGVLAILAVVIQGIYFGWPGGEDYDRHFSFMIWDAVPAARLNIYGYDQPNTPFLSGWRDRMVLFEQAHSPANYTFPSHVSMFTGRYLREHQLYSGTIEESAIYDGFSNLAEDMSAQGYRPLLLTENAWLMTINRGFEVAVSCPTRSRVTKYFLPFYRGTFLIRQLIEHTSFNLEGDFKWAVLRIEKRILADWLIRARRDGPYFIFTNWMYFHSHYSPTVSEYMDPWERPQQDFSNLITFEDSYLKTWIGLFRRAGQLQDSLFMLTADHGNFTGEFGMYGHTKTLLEPVLHVPLLLFGDTIKPEIVSAPVPLTALRSAVDALVSGTSDAGWNIAGFIEKMLNNRGMVVEGSFDFEGPNDSIRWFLAAWEGTKKYMQDTHKYISGSSKGLDMDSFYFLYELDSDPGEKHNLARERLSEVDYMQEKIREWEDNLEPVQLPPPEEGEEGDYPPGLVEQLRALGYMR